MKDRILWFVCIGLCAAIFLPIIFCGILMDPPDLPSSEVDVYVTAAPTDSLVTEETTAATTSNTAVITEGKYKVGEDVAPGEYVIYAARWDAPGYFCISSDANEEYIIANDNFSYNSIVSVANEEYLKLSRAYAIPINAAKVDTSGVGMFKVGVHLPAGEYKVMSTGGTRGYYCVYSDSRHADIVVNDNFNGTTYVEVKNGEYLLLSRAKLVL